MNKCSTNKFFFVNDEELSFWSWPDLTILADFSMSSITCVASRGDVVKCREMVFPNAKCTSSRHDMIASMTAYFPVLHLFLHDDYTNHVSQICLFKILLRHGKILEFRVISDLQR